MATANTTPKPATVGGHLTSTPSKPIHPVVAQEIDGKTYSTRRATLIFNNGKGEALYLDDDPGYFLVTVSRFIGNVPVFAINPLSDAGLREWAVANGVLDRVTTKTAKTLVNKLMATKDGSAHLAKLLRKVG